MLDKFLEVSYGKTKEAEDKSHLVELMKQLPNEELMKIASGETKLSHYGSIGGGGQEWIQEFRGTPFFEQALALEQEDLQMQMQENQRRQQNREVWDATDAQRDTVCLKKRLMVLQLAQWQEQQGTPTPGQAEAAEHGMAQAAIPVAAPPPAAAPQMEAAAKTAAELTTEGREKIKEKNFSLSAEQSDTGKPAYPIEDKSHAANALARVKQFGSPAEKAEVYKDVAKKYPGLAMRSSVEEVKEKAKKAGMGVLPFLGAGGALHGALEGEKVKRPIAGAVHGGLGAMSGGLVGGMLGGAPGALSGNAALRDVGAAVGLGIGAVLNARSRVSALKSQARSDEAKEASPIYPPVSKGGKTMSLKPAEHIAEHGTEKIKAADQFARLMARADYESALEKNALLPALAGLAGAAKAALPGVGRSLQAVGRGTMSAYRKGGLAEGVKSFGRLGGQFAQHNPLAAAGMAGAAGLGAGYMASS